MYLEFHEGERFLFETTRVEFVPRIGDTISLIPEGETNTTIYTVAGVEFAFEGELDADTPKPMRPNAVIQVTSV